MNGFLSSVKEMYHILTDFNFFSILFRVFIATLCGGLIGSEREKHGRAAGVRTHTLVCLGASMTVMVGLYANYALGLSGDPLRVGAQVISGIGFLGAGTIMTRHHSQITGLTTAAGLWTTASLGLAIGLGFYQGAWIGFIAMEIAVRAFSRHERLKHTYEYYLELDSVLRINEFSDQFYSNDISIQVLQAKSGIPSNVGITIAISSTDDPRELLKHLRSIEYVVIAMPVK
ncbi:MAG: MgtC/SapB family protein [Faecousia sp.]